jgi:hypothetical protein
MDRSHRLKRYTYPLALALALAALAVTSLAAAVIYVTAGQPECPTEDSCDAVYVDGFGWTVVEVTP